METTTITAQPGTVAISEPPAPPKFAPFGDRLVVAPIEDAKESAGGIIIPDVAQEKPQTGRVIAAGPKCEQATADLIVLFSRYAGTDIEVDGVAYKILREDDLMLALD